MIISHPVSLPKSLVIPSWVLMVIKPFINRPVKMNLGDISGEEMTLFTNRERQRERRGRNRYLNGKITTEVQKSIEKTGDRILQELRRRKEYRREPRK